MSGSTGGSGGGGSGGGGGNAPPWSTGSWIKNSLFLFVFVGMMFSILRLAYSGFQNEGIIRGVLTTTASTHRNISARAMASNSTDEMAQLLQFAQGLLNDTMRLDQAMQTNGGLMQALQTMLEQLIRAFRG